MGEREFLMNIYQAAKAVAEGRAEDARRPLIKGGLMWMLREEFVDMCDLTATDWELVGEKPKTERVEVKRWAKLGADGAWFGSTCRSEQAHEWQRKHPDCFIQEISFYFDRPLPEEVTEVEREVILDKLSTEAVPGGLVVDLPAAWVGKKVRVELI